MRKRPHGPRSGVALALLVGLLVSVAPTAQTPQTPAVPEAGSHQQPRPDFRVAVNLVTTDVIVRTGTGQFVADLTKDDFEVFEDGVPQEVASLVLVHGGRVFNLQAPPPPPPQEGIILPSSRPRNDTAGRVFVIFIDDLHLDFRNTGRIRSLFRKVATTLIHDGDMFGIVSTGPSSLAIDLTYDRNQLDMAVKKVTGSGLRPSDIFDLAESGQGPSEVLYRTRVAFSTAAEIMRNLERLPNRRKSFIYISNGYDFNPFPEGRLGETPDFGGSFLERDSRQDNIDQSYLRQGLQFADVELARMMIDLVDTANRASTTLYTIDPRGLVGMSDIDEKVDPSEWNTYVRKTQDSLRTLAEETGGIAVVNQNDFDKALKRIDAETSDYYVLGYYTNNPDPTQRRRQLDVKVKREGVDVWSRKSYALQSPPTPVSSAR